MNLLHRSICSNTVFHYNFGQKLALCCFSRPKSPRQKILSVQRSHNASRHENGSRATASEATSATGKGDRGRETTTHASERTIDRSIDKAPASRSTRRGEKKEDGEAKGSFGPELLPSQEEGRSRREGGRECPASGQPSAGGVGQDL